MICNSNQKRSRFSARPAAKFVVTRRFYQSILGLAAAWLVCCVAPAAAQIVKIPFAALSPNYAPLWIASDTGLFKKYTLDVQLIYISAGSVIVPAILYFSISFFSTMAAVTLTP